MNPGPLDLPLLHKLEAAWSAETSVDPAGWTPDNPAWGQCAITALHVDAVLGGDIMRCVRANGESHYCNAVPDEKCHEGLLVNYTRSQFPDDEKFEDWTYRGRLDLLTNDDTRRRYFLLLDAMGER